MKTLGLVGGFEYNKDHNYKNSSTVVINPFNINLDTSLFFNTFNKRINIVTEQKHNKSKKINDKNNKRRTHKNI